MDAPYCPGRQVHWLKHLVVTRIVGKERSYKAADEELKAIVPTMRALLDLRESQARLTNAQRIAPRTLGMARHDR